MSNRYRSFLILGAAALALAAQAPAQSLLGRNLIVNGDAEAGAAVTDLTAVSSSVPGWTTKSSLTVLQYSYDTLMKASDRGPAVRGNAYFAGGPNNGSSSATQTIDISASAAAIDG